MAASHAENSLSQTFNPSIFEIVADNTAKYAPRAHDYCFPKYSFTDFVMV